LGLANVEKGLPQLPYPLSLGDIFDISFGPYSDAGIKLAK
jgi:hypothetical protein